MLIRLLPTNQNADVCRLPADAGPCRGSFRKYYFDRNSLQCLELRYGGCRGNGNRFSSVEECQSLCLQRAEINPPGNVTSDVKSSECFYIFFLSSFIALLKSCLITYLVKSSNRHRRMT